MIDEYNKIITGIREFFDKAGYKDAIIGLSGGIDSALTATLAVRALGKNHVLGVLMPSEVTSRESIDDALELAENLGINIQKIPIDKTYDYFNKGFRLKNPIAKQNLQARLRGLILMTLSNEDNALVLCTGNKTECQLGYCTLYGDSCGSLAPISHLYKTDVWGLSIYINEEQEVIPKQIITKKPSAELCEGQTDEADFGMSYEEVDKMLRSGKLEGRIKALHERSHFKRLQLPPGI